MGAVLRVNAKLLLLVIESALFFLGLAVSFYFMYRKQSRKKRALERKNEAVRSKLDNFSGNLEKKFRHIRCINTRLQEITASSVQDPGRSDEYRQLMAEFDKSNREFDLCIEALKKQVTPSA